MEAAVASACDIHACADVKQEADKYLAAGEQGEDVVGPDVEVDQVLADPLDQNGVAGCARQPVIPNAKDDDIRHCYAPRPAATATL